MRRLSDLQGVLFGVRGDEVVTQATLTLSGATSPALIPELSQIAITLNEQFIGAPMQGNIIVNNGATSEAGTFALTGILARN